MTTLQAIKFKCDGKVHAVRREFSDGKVLLEVRCKDGHCVDRRQGEVVFHYFDLVTGTLDHDKRYKEPFKVYGSAGSTVRKDES